MSALLFHAGAECYDFYGSLSKRTSLEEDVAETFTRATPPAYYVDRNGVLRLAEVDALRTEWTGSDFSTPNVLLEGARTNAWTRSEALDDAAWTKTRCSISADATTAPDGATTADKIVEDGTASSTHNVSRAAPAVTNDTNQAFSLFAKAAERSEIRVTYEQQDGSTAFAYIDLSTGTIGTTNDVVSVSVEAMADGWYRIELVADSASGGTTDTGYVYLSSGSETISYNGDGSSGVYVWGMQFEVDQSSGSSYIQTVGSTVTRAAETLTLPFQFKPQEMTFYLRFIEGGTILGATDTRILHIGTSAGADPRFLVDVNSNNYRVAHDTGTTGPQATLAGAPSVGDLVELRAVLAADGSVTIGQSIAGASETTATTATTATLGSAWAGTNLYINSVQSTNHGFVKNQSVKAARGTKTMAEMRALGV